MICCHFHELAGVPITKGSFSGCGYKQLPNASLPPARELWISHDIPCQPWKNAGKLVGIFKVNRQMWFRCGVFFFFYIVAADTRRAHLLSVPLTTQTDIAPVKYNLELTGEWLLSFHSISPSWLRSKGSTHQYPPQPLPACFIIQCSDVFERNIALHGLFQQLNPVNEPNSYTHTHAAIPVYLIYHYEQFTGRTRTSQKASGRLSKAKARIHHRAAAGVEISPRRLFLRGKYFLCTAVKMSRRYMYERQYHSLLSSK